MIRSCHVFCLFLFFFALVRPALAQVIQVDYAELERELDGRIRFETLLKSRSQGLFSMPHSVLPARGSASGSPVNPQAALCMAPCLVSQTLRCAPPQAPVAKICRSHFIRGSVLMRFFHLVPRGFLHLKHVAKGPWCWFLTGISLRLGFACTATILMHWVKAHARLMCDSMTAPVAS